MCILSKELVDLKEQAVKHGPENNLYNSTPLHVKAHFSYKTWTKYIFIITLY